MFVVPLVTAIGSAIGGIGTAIGAGLSGIGSAVGIGEAATTAITAGTTAGTTAGATGLGSLFSWNGLGLIGSGISALSSINQGNQMAEAYRLQATNAIIQGNQQSLEYQRQGLQVMRRVNETDAAIKARAGAGGIDPFSGSPGTLADVTFARGLDEYFFTRDAAEMSILGGQSNAAAYRTAAANASSAGMFNALGTLALGVGRFGAAGGFGKG